MNSWILILILTISSYNHPVLVQQEFNTRDKCEAAREQLSNLHQDFGRTHLVFHGCFKK